MTIEREGQLVPNKTWGAISEPIESIAHHVQHHPASTLALRTPLVLWISKDVVRIRITAALLPLPSLNGTTSGEALHVYSQDDTDGVCIIQHENCIKHEHSVTVSTDHVSLWLMEGLSKWRGFYSGCLDRMWVIHKTGMLPVCIRTVWSFTLIGIGVYIKHKNK